MYENIYEMMVEAGIAEKKEKELQYKAGCPSHFVLTKPEYLLFVDGKSLSCQKMMGKQQEEGQPRI
jgi:hypothetical protein